MEGVLIILDEKEVQEILEKHESQLTDHHEKIHVLEVSTATLKEKLNSVEGIVTRFEANSYQTQNNMMQLLSQVIVNTSSGKMEIAKIETQGNNDITKIKLNNKANITLKILAIIGGLISAVTLAYFSLKGIKIPPVM